MAWVSNVFRGSAALLTLAVLTLVVTSLVWAQRSAEPTSSFSGDPYEVVAAFERSQPASSEVDVGARYAGRFELIDPRTTLPTWHKHPHAEASAVFAATRQCPPSPLAIPIGDAALGKAYEWHAKTCRAGAPIPEELVGTPPFVHPSGHTYAALAFARGGTTAAFVKGHSRDFHALELAALEPGGLEDDGRVLRALGSREWAAIAQGDRLVVAPAALVRVEHGTQGVSRLRFYSRADWEKHARKASLSLGPIQQDVPCVRPASSRLCFTPIPSSSRHRATLVAVTTSTATIAVLAALALALAYSLERRRMHADRIHVLRTMTHELRTPATSLALDIEPLRAAYDELPEPCQEPLLRLSAGIARLNRVLHRSAKYMALFETSGATRDQLVTLRSLDSVADLFAELSDEWPEGVTLRAESEDGPVTVDAEWLGVAVRNLVENALRHGEPPVTVTWQRTPRELVVRVADSGSSPTFSLKRAIAPYHRDPKSPGLGLGLAIVARVAGLLGGKLMHEASPTVFELRVPTNAVVEDAS